MSAQTAGVRPGTKQIRVPYVKGDKRLPALALAVAETGFALNQHDAKIEKLKDARKPLAEAYKKADDELTQGSPVEVDVDFLYFHDLGRVWIRRKDDGTIIEKRDMASDEREAQDLFDEEETIEVDDGDV